MTWLHFNRQVLQIKSGFKELIFQEHCKDQDILDKNCLCLTVLLTKLPKNCFRFSSNGIWFLFLVLFKSHFPSVYILITPV